MKLIPFQTKKAVPLYHSSMGRGMGIKIILTPLREWLEKCWIPLLERWRNFCSAHKSTNPLLLNNDHCLNYVNSVPSHYYMIPPHEYYRIHNIAQTMTLSSLQDNNNEAVKMYS